MWTGRASSGLRLGRSDIAASASLICKCADAFGSCVIVVDPPIRAGEAKKLRRAGELERYVELAASHEIKRFLYCLIWTMAALSILNRSSADELDR